MNYELGQEVEHFGSVYVVERLYSLTDAEMKAHNLYHRNRITIRKVSGVYGLPSYDNALPESS